MWIWWVGEGVGGGGLQENVAGLQKAVPLPHVTGRNKTNTEFWVIHIKHSLTHLQSILIEALESNWIKKARKKGGGGGSPRRTKSAQMGATTSAKGSTNQPRPPEMLTLKPWAATKPVPGPPSHNTFTLTKKNNNTQDATFTPHHGERIHRRDTNPAKRGVKSKSSHRPFFFFPF